MYGLSIPISLGTSKTGLTLQAQLFDVLTGDAVGSPLTDTFIERGQGRYVFTTDALPDNQAIGVAFLSGVDELASTVVNPSDVYDILAMKTKLDSINVDTAVTIAVPIDPVTGNVTVVRGDVYAVTEPKGALVWNELTGLWLAYVGLPAVFTAKDETRKVSISRPATVAVVSGNHVSVTVELPSNATSGITDKQLGDWAFDCQSTVGTHADETILAGTLTILEDISPPSA